MKTYFLFRHGDTYETKNHLAYDKNIFTSPIIPEARAYLRRIGRFLRDQNIDYFATSDIKRCQQTSEIIFQESSKTFTVDKRITEFDPDSSYTPESNDHFISRIKSFLSDMEKSEHSNIAVCGHGSGIACLSNLIRFDRFSEDEFLDYPPPGVLWIVKGESLEEKDFR